jgi:hypothetical protein
MMGKLQMPRSNITTRTSPTKIKCDELQLTFEIIKIYIQFEMPEYAWLAFRHPAHSQGYIKAIRSGDVAQYYYKLRIYYAINELKESSKAHPSDIAFFIIAYHEQLRENNQLAQEFFKNISEKHTSLSPLKSKLASLR